MEIELKFEINLEKKKARVNRILLFLSISALLNSIIQDLI